ncbi:hypothetical protein ACP3UN_25310 [Klebsiella pneumoniae]|nr:hypothetical protein [Klebsiella pneumoniae]HBW1083512.1 hypothetical protein [Klebsiella pneumoniae]HDK5888021.1 hypothetical protein [Klebsiella variicola]
MAKHLKDEDISDVCKVLDSWPTDAKLTWDRLVSAVEHDLGFKTTRQTLQKHVRIKKAFTEVKGIISGDSKSSPVRKNLPSLKIAAERITTQERTIKRLEEENRQLLEQFSVWLYNAYRHDITIEQLNEPLPKKDNQ